MEDNEVRKEFKIGGRTFEVRPPVLRQLQQVSRLLAGLDLGEGGGIEALMDSLDDALPRFLAVVLVEEGVDIRTRDLDEASEFLAWNADGNTAVEVLQSFFDSPEAARQVSSMGNLRAMLTYAAGTERIMAATRAAGARSQSRSTEPSSSLPEGTSPSATESLTGTPLEKSSHG